MIKNFILLASAAFLLIALLLPAQAAAQDIVFSGEVSYRERIAMPERASLRITLVSLGQTQVRVVSASSAIGKRGHVPLQFTLNVRSNVMDAAGHYGLMAEIIAGGAVQFRNVIPVAVPPEGASEIAILVNFDPQPIESEPAPVLLETIWQASNIAGTPVVEATKVSLSIASDRRAGGHGGCNDYFTEAMLDGSSLVFGPVAGTRMACAANVMAQEAAFFAMLGQVRGYEVDGQVLYLLGADGDQLVLLTTGK